MKISCPYCGNDSDFYEVAEGVTITTFYRQNDDSEIEGEVRLFCGECHKELKEFHEHFIDMLF
jgi:hypothetical protein